MGWVADGQIHFFLVVVWPFGPGGNLRERGIHLGSN